MRRNTLVPQGKQETFVVPIISKAVKEVLEKYVTPTKIKSILDIGCGEQPFKQLLDKNINYKSLDFSQNTQNNVDYIYSLLHDIDIKEKFDFLMCTEVLEHIPNWDSAFTNFSKLINTNGKILITCPFLYPLHEEPYDFWRPTGYSIEFYANKYNFSVIEKQKAGDFWSVLGTVLASSYLFPKNNSIKSKLYGKIFYGISKYLFNFIRKEKYKDLVSAESNWYTHNIYVLEKR